MEAAEGWREAWFGHCGGGGGGGGGGGENRAVVVLYWDGAEFGSMLNWTELN